MLRYGLVPILREPRLADVFLSYARPDHAIAERLAAALGAAGLSVWWDRHIKGGAEFSRDIEQELEAAGRIVVLWSKDSIQSRWVRDEAGVAADSGRLVGVAIDGTPPPLGFRQFQTIDLKGWRTKKAALPSGLLDALHSWSAPAPDKANAYREAAAPVPRKWLLIGAVVLALLGLGAFAIVRQPAGLDQLFGKRADPVSIAIMPFDVSGRADLSYLSVGLAGALSNGLSKLDGLQIIATSSARAIAEEDLTANQVGDRLQASHLVEGEIVPNGDKLRASIRLVNAANGAQLWAQNYDGLGTDLGQLEFAIGRDLAAALNTRLGIGDGSVAARGRVDPRAYEAYLKGLERTSTRYDDDARKDAVRQFQLASTIAPDFADAHAGLAHILSLSQPHQIGWTKQEIRRGVDEGTARALRLDPGNLMALAARAHTHLNFTGDADAAIGLARQILDRAPNSGPGHYAMASGLLLAGRAREAIPHFDRAIENDPYNNILRVARVIALGQLADYDGVRREALACPKDCARFDFLWLFALSDVGRPDEVERDLPILLDRLKEELPPKGQAEIAMVIRAQVAGKPFTVDPAEPDLWGYDTAAIFARAGRLDEALRIARHTAANSQADMAVAMLTNGNNAFPPEARADPRYHAMFRDIPHLRRIEAIRRANKVLAGLPIAADGIEAEKRRLADARRR